MGDRDNKWMEGGEGRPRQKAFEELSKNGSAAKCRRDVTTAKVI